MVAPTTIVLVVAHGSRAADANDAHRRLVAELGARTARPVRAAFLELAEPSIPEAIDAAVADGAAEVAVLPYFLHPGRHLARDLPAIVADADARHPGSRVHLTESFGARPELLDVLAAQVAELG